MLCFSLICFFFFFCINRPSDIVLFLLEKFVLLWGRYCKGHTAAAAANFSLMYFFLSFIFIFCSFFFFFYSLSFLGILYLLYFFFPFFFLLLLFLTLFFILLCVIAFCFADVNSRRDDIRLDIIAGTTHFYNLSLLFSF